LVFTDPKIRAAAADEVKGRVGKVTQTASRRYEDAMDRLEAAGDALQGRNSGWGSRLTGFLLGVGVGAGLGMLLAPASGTETREALRERAVEMKNRVVDSASTAVSDARHSVTSMPSTGTQG
jgi:hypothetical protein